MKDDLNSCQEAEVEDWEEEQYRVESNPKQAVALIQWMALSKKGGHQAKTSGIGRGKDPEKAEVSSTSVGG